MSDWKECTIGDLGKIITGKTPRTAIAENYGGKVPFLSPSDNMEVKYVDATNKTLTEQGVKEVKNCLLPKDAVCVSCIGSDLGKVLITTQQTVTNQQINSIIVNNDNDVNYIYYLMTIVGKHLNIISKTSTAVPIINKSSFSNYKISVPTLAEQKKIAAILSSLDEKIETNRKINIRLEELAQAIFKSWFIDFEPFGGKMPEDWEEDSIYRYVDVIYGAPYKSELFNNDGYGLPLIRIRDLKTNIPQIYTTEILPNTEYINPGNIVVGMDAEFEPYFWFGEKGLLNQRVCKFKSKCEEVGNSFILYLTQPKLRFVQSYKVGTTVSHLGKSDIDKFRFIYPPLEVIENFTKISEPILERRIELSKESSRLAALRDTLLPKLMSGELIPE